MISNGASRIAIESGVISRPYRALGSAPWERNHNVSPVSLIASLVCYKDLFGPKPPDLDKAAKFSKSFSAS
jgi:hypothetical protein